MITFYVTIALSLVFSMKAIIAGESLPLPNGGSTFLDQLEIDSYPSLPSPNEAALFRWDFSGKQVYQYEFSQLVLVTSEIGNMHGNEASKASHQSIQGDGKLSLKSEGNKSARLVLENLTMSMEVEIPESDEPQIIQSQAPPIVIQGVQEDGSMKLGNSGQEILLKTLFPIPPKPLKVGQSVSVPAEMPFNVMGSLLHVKGKTDIKLSDYVQVNGKTCAKLETEIDISTLNVPVELKGEYQCQIKGRSIFFFNVEDKHFVAGRVAMLMSMHVEAPIPKMNFPKETEGIDIPETFKMSMDSDNFLSVNYAEN
jgi:hypothetical protein